jgi:hypothetical protein
MATLQTIKQSQYRAVVKLMGNSIETNAVAVDASALSGAEAATFNELTISNISWSSTGTNKITLIWDGTTDANCLTMEGNGDIHMLRDFNCTLTNNATAPTGDILITTTTNDPYTIILTLEKGVGFTKPQQ